MKYTLMMIALMLISAACTKQEKSPNTRTDYSNAVWVTPNGKVIPYSERADWKAYEKAHFTQEKRPKTYQSIDCSTATIKCGLKCEIGDGGDCIETSECAPCMNCGCTPIENPYD